MDLYYTIIIQETTPSDAMWGWIWLKPSEGKAYKRINGAWTEYASGEVVASFTPGYYWRKATVQVAEPSAVLGDIWIKSSTHEAYMYFSTFNKYAG